MSVVQPADIDTPDQHITFLKRQWRALAAFAWQKYLSEGRGAVVVDLRNASTDGPNLNVPTFYIAEASERLAKLGGWPNQEIAEVVRDYDPEQDVVFIFLRLDGDIYHYNVSDELTPPKAHAARQTSVKAR
ncbi:MAG TPA: hypothetical protein VNN73_11380 [Blastocatellia bacterium]|nr:hypothetical protein [Blastocatellia bacterium]